MENQDFSLYPHSRVLLLVMLVVLQRENLTVHLGQYFTLTLS